MSSRRSWKSVSGPLIFPILLTASLYTLTEVLSSLSGFDNFFTGVIGRIPSSLTPEFSVIAFLGSVPALILAAIIFAAVEFRQKHLVRGYVMLGSLVSLLSFFVLKESIRRARPVTEFVASHGLHDFSFPSGHATGSAAVYGIIALLLWSGSRRAATRVASVGLIILILFIGVSRVYLGAHFPTDVVGGWLLALIIVSILRSISLAAAKKSSRPAAEAEKDTTESTPA